MTIIELNDAANADWLRMRLSLWPRGSRVEHAKEMAELVGDPNFVGFLAKDPEFGAVGFAEVFLRPYANGCESRPVPFLEGIWVDPEHRQKRVGVKLIEAIEEWCRDRGHHELGSDTGVNNILSRAAHASWGFEETERVVYFRKKF